MTKEQEQELRECYLRGKRVKNQTLNAREKEGSSSGFYYQYVQCLKELYDMLDVVFGEEE